jgi:hypothetical protein
MSRLKLAVLFSGQAEQAPVYTEKEALSRPLEGQVSERGVGSLDHPGSRESHLAFLTSPLTYSITRAC